MTLQDGWWGEFERQQDSDVIARPEQLFESIKANFNFPMPLGVVSKPVGATNASPSHGSPLWQRLTGGAGDTIANEHKMECPLNQGVCKQDAYYISVSRDEVKAIEAVTSSGIVHGAVHGAVAGSVSVSLEPWSKGVRSVYVG